MEKQNLNMAPNELPVDCRMLIKLIWQLEARLRLRDIGFYIGETLSERVEAFVRMRESWFSVSYFKHDGNEIYFSDSYGTDQSTCYVYNLTDNKFYFIDYDGERVLEKGGYETIINNFEIGLTA